MYFILHSVLDQLSKFMPILKQSNQELLKQ
jgi:hypothetical protein